MCQPQQETLGEQLEQQQQQPATMEPRPSQQPQQQQPVQPPPQQPGSLAARVLALKGSRGREPFAARVDVARELYREALAQLDSGLEVDWEWFRDLDIGIRLSPLSWEGLLGVLAEAGLLAAGGAEAARAGHVGHAAQPSPACEEALGKLGRSWQQLRAYYRFQEQVLRREYASTADFLLVRVFGVPERLATGRRKEAALPADFYDVLRVEWRENDFPYFWEEGIEDHCVWANKPLTPQQLQQVVAQQRQGYEFVTYVNPPSLMSVPAIWHAHVVSRRAPPPPAAS